MSEPPSAPPARKAEPPRIANSVVATILASAGAGITARVCTHPLDTVRARIMAADAEAPVGGFLRSLIRIVSGESVRALYSGLGVALLFQAPAQVSYLTTYDVAKRWLGLRSGAGSDSAVVHFFSGMLAETVSCVFWVPMEVIKQRLQVRSMGDARPLDVIRRVIRAEGYRAFFRGYLLTLGVFGPYSALYFVVYESAKQWAASLLHTPVPALPSAAILASAATAAAAAAAVTSPLDVVKTRLQTNTQARYRSGWHALRTIVRDEGPRALLRGLSARVLWIMPGTTITMVAYERFKQLLGVAV